MRRLDAAPLVAGLGGMVLLISLFLHWYQPALTAWRVFEVLDLVLAALAIGALWLAAVAVLQDRPRRPGALPAIGVAAFVIVVSQLVNHPPAAQGASVEGGAWLALAASALMASGGILDATGVSLSVSFSRPARQGDAAAAPSAPPPGRGTPAGEAAAVEPEVQDELYPEHERRGPIGADDPEPWRSAPEDETLAFDPEKRESA
ncbi:MAG TPA: hypothetical protein VFL87_05385 [Thermoleophilaceae bacterium]|nr:hypothetical protein [Thermoleophilaceae bacterium]